MLKQIYEKAKKNIFWVLVGGVAMAAPLAMELVEGDPITDIETVQRLKWVKPTTDNEWKMDIKKEDLQFRSNEVLDKMEVDIQNNKIPEADKELARFLKYPDAYKAEMDDRLVEMGYKGQALTDELNKQVMEKQNNLQLRADRYRQVLERIKKTKELRTSGKVDHSKDILP